MTYSNAISIQTTTTVNGVVAFKQTHNACVDLFYKIGASRGKDILPVFVAAYVENPQLALRIAAWARDVRQGAGERELFRQILSYLGVNQPQDAARLIKMVPTLGRFDDLLVFNDKISQESAFALIKKALNENNALAAKWMPRKGPQAEALRKSMNLTPKAYRQLLVSLTRVVETQMCNKTWDNINFSAVPSLAHARYKKAFIRNSPAYFNYVRNLVAKDKGVKINAGAVYPYDILKGRLFAKMDKTEMDVLEQQWNALPNYVGENSVLPLVDVSGSMTAPLPSNASLTYLEIAVGLGLYFADKNIGSFKDCFLTFSGEPELLKLKGTINQKIDQMVTSHWAMNTNLTKAFSLILKTALEGQVKAEEMPKILLILSDMQFDQCMNLKAIDMIKAQYDAAGYTMPVIVFWNLNDYENVPVQFDKKGAVLVSGFSPVIADAILKADLNDITPEKVMLFRVMDERYNPEAYQ